MDQMLEREVEALYSVKANESVYLEVINKVISSG